MKINPYTFFKPKTQDIKDLKTLLDYRALDLIGRKGFWLIGRVYTANLNDKAYRNSYDYECFPCRFMFNGSTIIYEDRKVTLRELLHNKVIPAGTANSIVTDIVCSRGYIIGDRVTVGYSQCEYCGDDNYDTTESSFGARPIIGAKLVK